MPSRRSARAPRGRGRGGRPPRGARSSRRWRPHTSRQKRFAGYAWSVLLGWVSGCRSPLAELGYLDARHDRGTEALGVVLDHALAHVVAVAAVPAVAQAAGLAVVGQVERPVGVDGDELVDQAGIGLLRGRL